MVLRLRMKVYAFTVAVLASGFLLPPVHRYVAQEMDVVVIEVRAKLPARIPREELFNTMTAPIIEKNAVVGQTI